MQVSRNKSRVLDAVSCVIGFTHAQVLEAWLGRSKALVETEIFLKQTNSSEGGLPASNRGQNCSDGGLGLALVEVMELAMEALVHPSKLISSIAPVLLEHVVNLRQVRWCTGKFVAAIIVI